ncbi:hypothetical protein [Microcoleus sp. LEGE 07076]|uniref:hypothetical protein n=1 Tax=Microcoleus sp. LEGE 07076 TaxID=915322 RepID=UPI0018827814|nr:hypothetical protein [Microcoleus sp. LEGE 07076]
MASFQKLEALTLKTCRKNPDFTVAARWLSIDLVLVDRPSLRASIYSLFHVNVVQARFLEQNSVYKR